MALGENLKDLRIAHNLSQLELSEKLGVKRSTIGSWESNRTEPSMQDIKNICDYFNVDISDLTGIAHKTTTTKDSFELTDGEKQLIMELREFKEIDAKRLELMFNTILHYKQDNGTLKINGVPSDHRVFMVTEDNFLNNKKPSSSWASHARKDKPNGTNGSSYRYGKK